MSLWNSIMSDTVGVVWRASSGTVDPWTKANIVEDAQTSIAKAMGPNADANAVAAAQQAQADAVTNYLTSQQADPSQWATGAQASPSTAWNFWAKGQINGLQVGTDNTPVAASTILFLSIVLALVFFGIGFLRKGFGF